MNIQAKVVADSINQQGDRLTTMLITFPRIILAELNTHRMLSKNSASSRAIPFEKMVAAIRKDDAFIPIAWQKDHKGMQGTEYFTEPEMTAMHETDWEMAKLAAIERAKLLHNSGVTKQMCNRLLEPFMMHTVLISGTEWENFFKLRCPQYSWQGKGNFRSWRDLVSYHFNKGASRDWIEGLENADLLTRLQNNKGQAEIHMMVLAEAMWDAMNESTPAKLEPGRWHLPFADKYSVEEVMKGIPDHEFFWNDYTERCLKISTAMAARTSYTVVGDEKEISIEKLIAIHDRMAKADPFHASPFEHCAKAMTAVDYHSYIKGGRWMNGTVSMFPAEAHGWCRNFKGFIQYREFVESDLRISEI